MAMMLDSELTATGEVRFVVVPSPSWPELFMPHAQMVPSVLRAYVDWPPAAIAVMPVIAIDVGVTRVNVVPSPSWPYALYPHAHTVPESVSTTTWLEPAATAGPALAADTRPKSASATVRERTHLFIGTTPAGCGVCIVRTRHRLARPLPTPASVVERLIMRALLLDVAWRSGRTIHARAHRGHAGDVPSSRRRIWIASGARRRRTP